MALTMYDISVPVFAHFLGTHVDVLAKAQAHCGAHGIDERVLMDMRLHPTMFTMAQQTYRAVVHACTGVALLAELEPPSLPERSENFADLIALAREARAFVTAAKAERIVGSEDRMIEFQRRIDKPVLSGRDFLLRHILPNFHFHITTGYDILRQAGVDLGKSDFIGPLPTPAGGNQQ